MEGLTFILSGDCLGVSNHSFRHYTTKSISLGSVLLYKLFSEVVRNVGRMCMNIIRIF